jgi:putative iron-only hydrogenase system regulator
MGESFLLPHRSGAALFIWEVAHMNTRVAVMSIIVENPDAVEQLNAILHQHGEYIIGRMGIPYRKRKISIISIALDAPQNVLSGLAGKIGALTGISVKTAYSSIISTE